jgi:hypothetical protein
MRASVTISNRPVRTRTHGGVAGVSGQRLPLCRSSRLTGRDLLRLEVKEQNAIADTCGVVGLGNLERHEAAIRGDHWI